MEIQVEHRRLASDPLGATFSYTWEEFIALCEREGLEPGSIVHEFDGPLDPSDLVPSDFDLLAYWLREISGGLLLASEEEPE